MTTPKEICVYCYENQILFNEETENESFTFDEYISRYGKITKIDSLQVIDEYDYTYDMIDFRGIHIKYCDCDINHLKNIIQYCTIDKGSIRGTISTLDELMLINKTFIKSAEIYNLEYIPNTIDGTFSNKNISYHKIFGDSNYRHMVYKNSNHIYLFYDSENSLIEDYEYFANVELIPKMTIYFNPESEVYLNHMIKILEIVNINKLCIICNTSSETYQILIDTIGKINIKYLELVRPTNININPILLNDNIISLKGCIEYFRYSSDILEQNFTLRKFKSILPRNSNKLCADIYLKIKENNLIYINSRFIKTKPINSC